LADGEQVIAESFEQSPMTIFRDPPDRAWNTASWEDSEETQTYHGWLHETTQRVVTIYRQQPLVKTVYDLSHLRADAADKNISESWHFPEEQRRPILGPAVCLGQHGKNYVAFFDGRYSALDSLTELNGYSGSSSP